MRTLFGCLLSQLHHPPHSIRFTARRVQLAAHADYRRRGVLGSLLRPWATDFNMPALSRTATSPTTCDNCPEIDYARHMPSVQQVRHIETRNDHAAACQDNSGPSGNNGECNIANGALNTIYRKAGRAHLSTVEEIADGRF